jgi:hypothetical protein
MSIAVIGLLVGFAASACTEEEKPYSCDAWCAADFSDLTTATFSATDANDAANQCFAAYNCNDMPGQLLKCKCEPL